MTDQVLATFELTDISTTDILINDEFFLCTKHISPDGKVEYGLNMHKSIDDTIKRLVELYEIEKKYNVQNN